jgi:hypothetical protein
VLITRRHRRRILLALLPLLTFVWATLPALPCCHEVAAASEAVMTAMAEHAGHAGHAGHHDGASVDEGFAVDHGANHCEEGPVANIDPPCTDIDKTSNDSRAVYFAGPWVVLTTALPALRVELETRAPPPSPAPPPRYRPLHLEKSVLLI